MAQPHPCRGHPGAQDPQVWGENQETTPSPSGSPGGFVTFVTCNAAGKKPAALPEPAAEVCLTKTVFKISCGINGQLQHWKDFA